MHAVTHIAARRDAVMGPAARPKDSAESPPFHQPSWPRLEPVERQLIKEIRIDVMTDVECGISSLQAQAVGLRSNARVIVTAESRDVVDRMGPSVMQIHFEA